MLPATALSSSQSIISGSFVSTALSEKSQETSVEQQVQTVASGRLCDSCGKNNAPSLCSRCKRVRYCNATCQKTAWKTHHSFICVGVNNPERYLQQDSSDLTPLHYAALYNKEKSLPLEQQNQLHLVKDKFNGTPVDLKNYLKPVSDGPISFQMMVNGEAVPLTQAEFFERTGVHFKDGYVAENPQALIQFRNQSKEEAVYKKKPGPRTLCYKADDPQVIKFEKEPPLVFLVEEDPIGFGVQAGQDLKKNDIICSFGGEFTLKERNTYRSRMYNLRNSGDQNLFSGKGAFINDGPPNCVPTFIHSYKGIPLYSVIRALRDIKKGELFHFSYGSDHGLRGGKYFISEQSLQEVVRFCRAGHFSYLEQALNKEDSYLDHMFLYIFSISSLFIHLHLREILNVKETQKLMGDFKQKLGFQPLFEYMGGSPTFFHCYPNLLETIAKILKIKQKDPEIVDAVDHLSKFLSEAAFVQVLNLMQKDPHLTSLSIPNYLAMGELYDHLYLVFNGTLSRTYRDIELGPYQVKIPNFQPDISMVKEKYASLPSHLKVSFLEALKSYIDYAKTEGDLHKHQEFLDLRKHL